MSSLLQIASNRRNSQLSTGPRSESGKAHSAMNALKSGIYSEAEIVPGEDPSQLEELIAEYYGHHQPASPEARDLVDILIHSTWLLRRFRRAESQVVARLNSRDDISWMPPHTELGRAWDGISQIFARIQRRIDATQRNFRQALQDLYALEAAQPATAQPEERPETPQPQPIPAKSDLGFVPPSSVLVPAEARRNPRFLALGAIK